MAKQKARREKEECAKLETENTLGLESPAERQSLPPPSARQDPGDPGPSQELRPWRCRASRQRSHLSHPGNQERPLQTQLPLLSETPLPSQFTEPNEKKPKADEDGFPTSPTELQLRESRERLKAH